MLTAKQRDKLPKTAFALPEQRRFPIHNVAHIRNAASRLAQARKAGTVTKKDYNAACRRIHNAAKRHGITSMLLCPE